MLKTVDVTDGVRSLLPGFGDRRIAMSAGLLTIAEKPDDDLRVRLTAGLCWRALHGDDCVRQQLDDRQTLVVPEVGPRCVVIDGGTLADGASVVVIVSYVEWSLYAAGERSQIPIEVLERDDSAQRYVN